MPRVRPRTSTNELRRFGSPSRRTAEVRRTASCHRAVWQQRSKVSPRYRLSQAAARGAFTREAVPVEHPPAATPALARLRASSWSWREQRSRSSLRSSSVTSVTVAFAGGCANVAWPSGATSVRPMDDAKSCGSAGRRPQWRTRRVLPRRWSFDEEDRGSAERDVSFDDHASPHTFNGRVTVLAAVSRSDT